MAGVWNTRLGAVRDLEGEGAKRPGVCALALAVSEFSGEKMIRPFQLANSTREPPLNAFCSSAMSNFFIFRKACVTRAICHESPYRSFSHPHCSAWGTAESFSQ